MIGYAASDEQAHRAVAGALEAGQEQERPEEVGFAEGRERGQPARRKLDEAGGLSLGDSRRSVVRHGHLSQAHRRRSHAHGQPTARLGGGNRLLDRVVADVPRLQHVGAGGYVYEAEEAVGVGGRPVGCALERNVGVGQRLARVGVAHVTGHRHAPARPGRRRGLFDENHLSVVHHAERQGRRGQQGHEGVAPGHIGTAKGHDDPLDQRIVVDEIEAGLLFEGPDGFAQGHRFCFHRNTAMLGERIARDALSITQRTPEARTEPEDDQPATHRQQPPLVSLRAHPVVHLLC